MDTSIVVAIVAATAAVVAPALTWLAARQDANDLRKNIERDMDLLNRLVSGSETHRRLEMHVKSSIEEQIRRDESRRNFWRIVRFGFIPYALLVGSVLTDYISDPESYDRYFVGVNWLLSGLFLVWLVVAFYQTSPLGRKNRGSSTSNSRQQ